MKRSQVARVLAVLAEIRRGHYPSCARLAAAHGVTSRTILRDLDLLRDDWGAPLVYDPHRRGWCLVDPTWVPPVPTRLSAGEAMALLLGVGLLRSVAGAGLGEAFDSLREKLPTLLPDSVSVDGDALARQVSLFLEPLRGETRELASRLGELRRAVEERRVVEMEYWTASRDEVRTRVVEPYHLRYHDGAWYLVGFCQWRQAVRTFAVDRIRRLRVLEERYEAPPPERFSPETYFDEAWRLMRGEERFRVAVRFRPEQARFVRGRRWHPTQEEEEGPDGSLVLRFRVLGLEEVGRWVLSFGSGAEALEPPELRAWLAREAQQMAGMYGCGRGNGVLVHGMSRGLS